MSLLHRLLAEGAPDLNHRFDALGHRAGPLACGQLRAACAIRFAGGRQF
jgi:hypothetical protein